MSKIVQALHGLLYNGDRIVENPAIADPSWKIFLFVKPSAAASLAPSLVKQHFEHGGPRIRYLLRLYFLQTVDKTKVEHMAT